MRNCEKKFLTCKKVFLLLFWYYFLLFRLRNELASFLLSSGRSVVHFPAASLLAAEKTINIGNFISQARDPNSDKKSVEIVSQLKKLYSQNFDFIL